MTTWDAFRRSPPLRPDGAGEGLSLVESTGSGHNEGMKGLAQEVARLVESLPVEKAQALIEYARYLSEKADEEEWDRKFSDRRYAPKLKKVMAKVEREIRAGKSEPLNLDRL
jgi:hypothetical protein